MDRRDLEAYARRKARQHGVRPELVLAVIGQESHWDEDIESPAGAGGLMQLMPGTAAGLGVDPMNPLENIDGGVRYLAMQLKKYKGDERLALAAYNAGPGNVEKYGGIPPFEETQNYVKNVLGDAAKLGGGKVKQLSLAGTPSAQAPALGQVGAVSSPTIDLKSVALGNLSEIAQTGTFDPFRGLERLTEASMAAAPVVESPVLAPAPVDQTQGLVPNPSPGAKGAAPQGASPLASKVISFATSQLGQPYVWGGESRKEGGFDCSGLIDASLRAAGINLPGRLTTYTAAKLGKSVKGKGYLPGDLLITNGGKHMVMYVGGGKVIAAPRRGANVQFQPLKDFNSSVVDVRRVF